MRRKYITAVLLLLGLGVMSTLAISYTQVDLDESWGAEYIVNYVDAELSLNNPVTTINNATSVTVVLDASHVPAEVKSQIVVEAQDINTDPIVVDSTGAKVKVIFEDTLTSTVQQDGVSIGQGNPFRGTIAMGTAQAVDQVTIIWLQQTGFSNAYQYGSLTVTDIA